MQNLAEGRGGNRRKPCYLLAGILALAGCQVDDAGINFTAADQAHVQSEELMSAYLEDAADLAEGVLFADADIQKGKRTSFPGRSISAVDERYSCAAVSLEFAIDNIPESSGVVAIPHGFITIDYGPGCTTLHGAVRSGKLVIEFRGRRFVKDSYVSILFENYRVNGILITGYWSETNNGNPSNPTNFHNFFFDVESAVTFTFADGTDATRTASLQRVLQMQFFLSLDLWSVGGTVNGTTRDGLDYAVTYPKSLSYWSHCSYDDSPMYVPLEGTKELVVDSRKILIDYGVSFVQAAAGGAIAGCEREVSVSIDGKSKPLEISLSGN